MNADQELALLDSLSKGKAAKKSFFAKHPYNSNKYYNYQKRSQNNGSTSSTSRFAPTLKDMLHTASGKTQAIFKISSYGKGEKRVLAHMRYISRAGKLELEDQDGNKLTSTKEHKKLLNDWTMDFGDNKRSRDTMHLVLSTPPRTNRQNALQAAKEFLEKEYKTAGHDYIFVAHDDTDHPHVHAVIKMVSHLGKKLDPRKCYLREVRKFYAEIYRSHGINVEASSRCERGLPGQSQRSEFVHMKRTNRIPKANIVLINKVKQERLLPKIPHHPSEVKMLKRNQIIRKRYADKAKLLAVKARQIEDKNQKIKYLKAAKKLDDFVKSMPIEVTRAKKLHQQLSNKISATVTLKQTTDNKIYKPLIDNTKNLFSSQQAQHKKRVQDKDSGLELQLELEQ